MAGRPRKPPNTLQGHRPHRALAVVAVPSPLVEPEMPRGLLKVTQERWRLFWDEPAPVGSARVDGLVMQRYFVYWDEWERAGRAYRRARLVPGSMARVLDDGTVIGQMVINPLFAVMDKLEARMSQIEEKFGGTPLARLRMGVTLTQAVRTLDDLNRQFEEDEDERPSLDKLQVVS